MVEAVQAEPSTTSLKPLQTRLGGRVLAFLMAMFIVPIAGFLIATGITRQVGLGPDKGPLLGGLLVGLLAILPALRVFSLLTKTVGEYLGVHRARRLGFNLTAAKEMPAPSQITLPTLLEVPYQRYLGLVSAFKWWRAILSSFSVVAIFSVLPWIVFHSVQPYSPFASFVFAYVIFFIPLLVALFMLCLLAGAYFQRQRSMRILLLRPFNERRMSRSLERVIRHRIAPLWTRLHAFGSPFPTEAFSMAVGPIGWIYQSCPFHVCSNPATVDAHFNCNR